MEARRRGADAPLSGADLTYDQAQAVYGILTSGRAIDILVGPAGTGKTRAVARLAAAWRDSGTGRVIGLTTSTNAAHVLADEGLKESRNLADFLGKIKDSDQTRGHLPVRPGDLLIIGEASRAANARCSPCHCSVSRVITAADSPAEDPRNWPSAGTKSPVDSPCRYSRGSTSVIFGVLRAHGGKIAEENRFRSPVTGSVRLSLTRGAVTLHRPGAGQHFPRLVMPVPDHQPPAVLAALGSMRRDVSIDLGLQRLGQHPPRALPHDLVNQRPRPAGLP